MVPLLKGLPGALRPLREDEHELLLLGPLLGSVFYFPVKFKLRVLDPVTFDVPPDQERYSKSRIMDEAENIRLHMQENLFDILRTRKSVWTG